MWASKCEKSKWKDILRECFESDKDLIEKYHIVSGQGLEKCIEKTYEDLCQCEKLDFYTLEVDKKFAGYFGIEIYEEGYYLTGFFLMPDYRNSKFIKEFWKIVYKFAKFKFICGIYKKNERAKRFLEKKLFLVQELIDINDNNLLVFSTSKTKEICQQEG